jgi:hypothetical protein
MHKLDPVETVLARLMPPALSQEGQAEIEAMLDDLAGVSAKPESPAPVRGNWRRWWIASGAAAAGVAAAMMISWSRVDAPFAVTDAKADALSGLVLVGETDRIESMTEEGWQEDSDGSAMRAMRLNVVEENSFLDEESGIVMQISEPREEILLMPISAF